MTTTTGNRSVYRSWWAPLLEGLAAIGLGAVLLFQPAITLVVLTTFLGAYWLVDGIFKVIGAFTGQNQERSWWLMLLSGLLGIFAGIVLLVGGILALVKDKRAQMATAGIVVFSAPLMSTVITQVFLVFMLGIQAIIGGLLSIIWAIRARKEIQGEGWAIAGGILAVFLGVLLVSHPLLSVLVLARITAVIAIVGGIALVIAAFQLRSHQS